MEVDGLGGWVFPSSVVVSASRCSGLCLVVGAVGSAVNRWYHSKEVGLGARIVCDCFMVLMLLCHIGEVVP